MRTCIRCDGEMVEGLDIIEPMHGSQLKVARPETLGVMPKNNFGKIKAAVCPRCGYIETYLSRLDKIKEYQLNELQNNR